MPPGSGPLLQLSYPLGCVRCQCHAVSMTARRSAWRGFQPSSCCPFSAAATKTGGSPPPLRPFLHRHLFARHFFHCANHLAHAVTAAGAQVQLPLSAGCQFFYRQQMRFGQTIDVDVVAVVQRSYFFIFSNSKLASRVAQELDAPSPTRCSNSCDSGPPTNASISITHKRRLVIPDGHVSELIANRQRIAYSRRSFDRHLTIALNVCGNRQQPRG